MPATATASASARRSRPATSAGKCGGSASTSARGGAPAPERDALLTQHIGLVHHIARRMAARLSTAAELDELISAGTIGLVQAADSFDGRRGLSFSTFAVPRIRGAILDDLRSQDHLPRNVRRRMREVTRARDALTNSLQRFPTPAETSGALGVPANMLLRWELDSECAGITSLDQPLGVADGATLSDTVADDRGVSVDELLTHQQEVERLKEAIAALKKQERTVLALNFFEELKLHEIAAVMGLSVCRISQIRTAALEKLRVRLIQLRAA